MLSRTLAVLPALGMPLCLHASNLVPFSREGQMAYSTWWLPAGLLCEVGLTVNETKMGAVIAECTQKCQTTPLLHLQGRL